MIEITKFKMKTICIIFFMMTLANANTIGKNKPLFEIEFQRISSRAGRGSWDWLAFFTMLYWYISYMDRCRTVLIWFFIRLYLTKLCEVISVDDHKKKKIWTSYRTNNNIAAPQPCTHFLFVSQRRWRNWWEKKIYQSRLTQWLSESI